MTNSSFQNACYFLFYHQLYSLAFVHCTPSQYNRKPEKENLTQFYLIISVGGWLGGIFVSFISPIIFNTLLEYPIIVALFLITISSGKFKHILKESKKFPLHSSLAIILFFLIPWGIRISNNDVVYQKRNFYGIYRITDQPLLHYSVSLGFKDLVGQLIAEGIDVNSIYKDQTPLDIAIKNNQTEIANLLRKEEAEAAETAGIETLNIIFYSVRSIFIRPYINSK